MEIQLIIRIQSVNELKQWVAVLEKFPKDLTIDTQQMLKLQTEVEQMEETKTKLEQEIIDLKTQKATLGEPHE